MPFINLKIKWGSALDKEILKREILSVLKKQFPDIEFTSSDLISNGEYIDEFVDELYNIAINNTIPSVH